MPFGFGQSMNCTATTGRTIGDLWKNRLLLRRLDCSLLYLTVIQDKGSLMSPALPDQLAILTVSGTQADALLAQLAHEKLFFTLINSTGGILQEPEVSLLVGFHSDRLPILLEVVRKYCRPFRRYISTQGLVQGEMAGPPMLEAELGGARFYLMDLERFEQI
jgi:uncharacterized protein YaaQ